MWTTVAQIRADIDFKLQKAEEVKTPQVKAAYLREARELARSLQFAINSRIQRLR